MLLQGAPNMFLQGASELDRIVLVTFFYLFIYLLRIFTICFEEAISKLFERLHCEGRCCPVTVLRKQVVLLARLWRFFILF
jgi:hypothetical protein